MIINKALEMSVMIKESEELRRYQEAKKALSENPQLEYDLLFYLSLMEDMERSDMSFENLDSEKQDEIEALETFFSENKTIQNYLASEAEVKQMLTMINAIINKAIN